MFVPFMIGIVLTISLLLVSILVGLDREKGVYPTLLIAIALFYVVFAFEHGDLNQIILNSIVAGLFTLLALIGYRKSFTYIAIGLLLHGVFDVVYSTYANSPAPDWWAPFCLAIDVLLGLFLLFMMKKKRISLSPETGDT